MTAEQIIARYQASYQMLRTATGRRTADIWDAFGGLTDAEAERFIAAIVPVVAGAQTAVGGLVAAYLATLSRLVTGSAPPPAPVAADTLTTERMRGTPADEVYMRAVVTARAAISKGHSPAEAFRFGRERAQETAETDVVLAQRESMVQSISADERIVGYRRVLTGRSCAFCATASTQRYRTEELMPIHANCDCGVAPIYGRSDPGQVINRPLLSNLKAAARETGKRDYWAARHVTVDEDGNVSLPAVAVHKHGELGPVLGAEDHHFAGPSVAA